MDMLIDVLGYVLNAIGVGAIASAALNKEYNNKIVNCLMKVINLIGMNIWNAKNK